MDKAWARLGCLTPEEKVDLALDMSDGCVRVCADGIRSQCPGISEEELVEKLRARLEWSRRHHKH